MVGVWVELQHSTRFPSGSVLNYTCVRKRLGALLIRTNDHYLTTARQRPPGVPSLLWLRHLKSGITQTIIGNNMYEAVLCTLIGSINWPRSLHGWWRGHAVRTGRPVDHKQPPASCCRIRMGTSNRYNRYKVVLI